MNDCCEAYARQVLEQLKVEVARLEGALQAVQKEYSEAYQGYLSRSFERDEKLKAAVQAERERCLEIALSHDGSSSSAVAVERAINEGT